MRKRAKIQHLTRLLVLLIPLQISAHPTGNMISTGNSVLWSYIEPIDDPEHHACVMIWKEGSEPELLLRSEFPASDYMLYHKESTIYLIERKFIQESQIFESRILKMKTEGEPVIIWDWFEDQWRIGEGGFFMLSESQIVFASYPQVYYLEKGQEPVKYFELPGPVTGLRFVENEQILIRGENTCWLTDQNGKIAMMWDHLLKDSPRNAPLNRNQIFDIDYRDGELLLANWGDRSFETIHRNGARKVILQMEAPYAPHWVAYHGNEKMLFSSKLLTDGTAPEPNLVLFSSGYEIRDIWKN